MFENSLRYQFVLFFKADGAPAVDLNKAANLADVVVANDGKDGLLLKLREPELSQALVFGPTGGEQTASLSWAAQTGVWNMTWNATRLDLFCDAASYNAVTERQLSPSAATARVAANLAKIPTALDAKVVRVAVVITGQENNASMDPRKIIGDLIASATIRDSAETLPEILVRVNRGTQWNLSGVANPVQINRLETMNSVTGIYAPPPSQNRFVWQLDYSTDARATHPIPSPAIVDFFNKAAREIEGTLERVRTNAVVN